MSALPPTFLTVDVRRSGLRFSQRVYIPRIAGTILCALFISSVLITKPTPALLWGLLFVNVFVWPHLAYRLSQRSRDPMRRERHNLLIDVVFGGVWIGFMGVNLLPSALIVAMVGMNGTAGGGIKLFVQGIVLQCATGVLVLALFAVPISLDTTPIQLYACLPMLLIYPISLGYVTYTTALKLAEHKRMLMEVSIHDGMTNLYNRHHWEHLLKHEYDICLRHKRTATLVLFDIDHFKAFNDNFGHNVGDQAILLLARELTSGFRDTDVIGRFGGDEFAVILPQTRAGDALDAVNRIRESLSLKFLSQTPQLAVFVSVGIAEISPEMGQYIDWLKAADMALYRAKNKGRRRTEVA
ncbi:diguanylate cyclase AdrA [Pectobacterium parmentieri]|uniref:diguanylate cyclase n=1 Tax=Pectobacterium parmentieri TaxID=1905730 RepID=A0A8B3FDS6_PECPM|nr:diguanylate cyclase AdrA [Pectobacterium parmentieri]ACX88753.1 diguanylate cyclase [Pectobacterium parmentieri WPP163]AOR57997.1 diguanylate cyclase AdrA [Pectobacterium parmentieri]AYH02166.1 diguanylate cyclase AdrA [Pectobacterium parmentieri]AYH15247.1 diguanylate cyclase AdrA [Pectobacterium parmentieri]AYH18300.1 diguanylate cyclase AdrA [Pectobacterium parmentieri]